MTRNGMARADHLWNGALVPRPVVRDSLVSELGNQTLLLIAELQPTLLEAGDVRRYPPDITCRLPGIRSIDGGFTDGGIALRVVVEVIVEDELFTSQVDRFVEGRDLVSQPE